MGSAPMSIDQEKRLVSEMLMLTEEGMERIDSMASQTISVYARTLFYAKKY